MRKLFRTHRKLKITILIVIACICVYPLHLVLLHSSNAKHDRIWDELVDHAIANGITYKPTRDPSIDRVHFYDKTRNFRTRSGLTSNYQGYLNSSGDLVLPPIYKYAQREFCEGLAHVALPDGTGAFIHPDGSIAFKANYDYVSSFVNGMAQVRNEISSRGITPQIRTGFINQSGELVIPIQYADSRSNHFIGDYTLVYERTIYSPIYDKLMDGIDVSLGLEVLLPLRLRFVDKEGNQVSPSEVRRSIK